MHTHVYIEIYKISPVMRIMLRLVLFSKHLRLKQHCKIDLILAMYLQMFKTDTNIKG